MVTCIFIKTVKLFQLPNAVIYYHFKTQLYLRSPCKGGKSRTLWKPLLFCSIHYFSTTVFSISAIE